MPTMFNFIQNNIELSTKKEFIIYICKFYNKLLLDSFRQIGRTTAKLSYENNNEETSLHLEIEPPSSPKSESQRRQSSTTDRVSRKRQSLQENLEVMAQHKSIFAELAKELRNIEHCILFFSDLAERNKDYDFVTRITSNQGIHAVDNNFLSSTVSEDQTQKSELP